VVLFTGIARGAYGAILPKFLEHIVVLCFERRYPKQNSVNSFLPNSFDPLFLAGYATGFIERLMRAAKKVLGSHMQLSEKWF